MVDRLKPRRPKLLQIGQTRHHSTPLYLYIQNIKLVWNFGLLCARLARENALYTQPNTNLMVDHLSFFKPMRPKLRQTGINELHSTCTFRISNWFWTVVHSVLEQENLVYIQFVVWPQLPLWLWSPWKWQTLWEVARMGTFIVLDCIY